MSWFRKQKPVEAPKKQTCIELVEYMWLESGERHWDVRRDGHSVTDDYGYKSFDEATKAYTRYLAIERGELKVGLSKYVIEQTFVESRR